MLVRAQNTPLVKRRRESLCLKERLQRILWLTWKGVHEEESGFAAGTVLGGDDEAKSSAKESWNWEYQLAASLMGFGLVNPPRVPNGLGVLRCASASAVGKYS